MKCISTREESQAVNAQKFGIVLAGSGMCNGGRIVHHLKNGIWNPDNHIIFVGYQAHGTLGRAIVDGAKTIRIAGESINVKAKIHTIGGFSAHADRTDLLSWADRFRPTMPHFLVVHGESEAADSLASALRTRGFEACVAERDQEIQLVPREAGQKISEALEESRAAPRPVSIAEACAPADPGGAATEKEQTETVQPGALKRDERNAEKHARRANRRAVRSLENIADQMRDIFEKAESGEVSAEAQPLLDAVAVLLDSILHRSRAD